jgi:MYXO-CTERM domain-containing protein
LHADTVPHAGTHAAAKARYNQAVRRFVLALTLLALYAPRAAYGNGRFPKAQAIATVPGTAGRIVYLRATFGLLVSRDAGSHWRWLCEQAYGSVSTWDPPFATTRDGRLWIGMPSGLRVTQDGCEVGEVSTFAGETVTDFAEIGDGSRLYATTSTPDRPSVVWHQSLAGAWEKRGTIADLRVDTLDVAPSNESRLYVTGVRQAIGQSTRVSLFYRSDDGGRTLAEIKPALPIAGRLYLAAVDPADERRLFARILHDAGSELAVSTDAGATFRTVLHTNGAMFGFARSLDGKTYWAGSGDPAEGIWRSRDRGEHWEPMAKSSVFCLFADGPRLYACSNPYVPGGYAVAVSLDEGATLTPLATFASIDGAVVCDGGGGSTCEAAWPATRDAVAAKGAELRPASLPAGSAVASADAGPRPAPAPRARGCSCSSGETRSGGGEGPLALLVLFGWVERRRYAVDRRRTRKRAVNSSQTVFSWSERRVASAIRQAWKTGWIGPGPHRQRGV